jgi:hypothetical protein
MPILHYPVASGALPIRLVSKVELEPDNANSGV